MRFLLIILAFFSFSLMPAPVLAQQTYMEPDQAAQDCAFEVPRGVDRFTACFNDDVMSPDQKRIATCMVNPPYPAYPAFCAAGMQLSDEQRSALDCALQSGSYEAAAANCMAGFVSPEVGRAVQCLYQTNQNLWETAVCIGGARLTPEQAVVVNCMMQTGGQPYAFAGCVGTQLTVNEIQKCFTAGIGGSQGCFGPNNTIVKIVHNAWHDVTHGPGQGNDIVKIIHKPLGGRCSFVRNPLGRGC